MKQYWVLGFSPAFLSKCKLPHIGTPCQLVITFCILFHQILRPTRFRYIKIYEESGTQVLHINAATSPAVTFPQGTLGRQLTFRTLNFLFTEKRRYYVLLDPGECCMEMNSLMPIEPFCGQGYRYCIYCISLIRCRSYSFHFFLCGYYLCAVYTSRGHYLRAVFISLRASDCAATIWG